MMVSFVAAIEGGVAFGDERTERKLAATERDREAGVRFGLPLLSSLLSLDMSGRLGQKEREEGSEEIKVVRRHTEASLFNLLRHRLAALDQITPVDGQSVLPELTPGQLVEVTGQVVGNPLHQMFSLLRQILPYIGLDEDDLKKPKKNPSRSGNPAIRARAQTGSDQPSEQADDGMPIDEVVRLLFVMRDDLEAAAVRDIVVDGPEGIRAVMTMSREFFTDETTEYLRGGRFTALGKVTRVLDQADTINLTRRTALGLGGPDVARGLVQGFTEDQELFVEIGDPIIEAPAIQILPLALFV